VSQKNILIVDDDESLLDIASRALSKAGFHTARASDFEQLEALVDSYKPDLVLMDVHMPELFGDDVAVILRDSRGIKAPIYLYSSLDSAELASRAAEAQLDGYISKNEGISHLVTRVSEILGGD